MWEKNTGVGVQASGAVTLGQQLTQALTETASVTQSISALWKTEDLNDALYAVGAGISLSVSARTQIKLEWLDTYGTPDADEPTTADVLARLKRAASWAASIR